MWFNADDRLMQLEEVLAIPRRYRAAAMGVWVLCGTYCSGQLTNGFVPDEVVKEAGGTPVLRGWLVAVGLWVEADGGVAYTPRGCRVPSKQGVTQQRANTARRVANYRKRQQEKKGDQGIPDNVTPLRGDLVTPLVTPPHGIHTSSTEAKASALLPDQTVSSESTQSYVSNAPARAAPNDFDLATSERGSSLSGPVTIGATRLVATVIPNGKISDADRTILRIKASEAITGGRSEDDVAECLRFWLKNPKLGPNVLLCCMTEVDKRKLNGHAASTSDQRFMAAQAFKENPTRLELT